MPINDIDIKEIDSIVAIEILKDTYKFDVIQYDKQQLQKAIELLNLAITNRKIPETTDQTNDHYTVNNK